MPSKPRPSERRMLVVFLSRYDGGVWAEALASYDWRDEREDAAVELVATRHGDGKRVAIEHTLIQPFPRDVQDLEHFKPLLEIEKDENLLVTGRYLYGDVPVGTVQKGYEQAPRVENMDRGEPFSFAGRELGRIVSVLGQAPGAGRNSVARNGCCQIDWHRCHEEAA